ncbi:TonB-dependent receptor [Bacteroides sp. 519]|uniref:SusC/RagA family TonB-linked outer membrane protein n=1 Tax=Bacteroides sp. 519 TaxID=2302937 RepID=UPI0013D75E38|nr:TonB-dependent receptor [Bacteroides sp. 519]NDV57429.1 TonB-dependent receptor [Bacteroides sp. 519]
MKKNRRSTFSGSRKFLFALFALFLSLSATAQMVTVKGQVADTAGEPIIGASIKENGTTNGTITNFDGNFELQVNEGALLTISYIGYTTIEVKATANMVVTLKEDTELLDEVVVIGYGSVKRKDVTTSISSVSTKDLDIRPIVSAGQAIQGKAAGVSVIQPNGSPGAELSIRVRGTTSFNGSNDPLYVVDGVPVDNIGFLSANDIESMQILKDASSAAIYGARAANGVIIITTKGGAKNEAKISFNAQLTLSRVSEKIKPLNAQQYKDLQDEIGMISLPENLKDQTDWFDEAYSTGVMQSYQASVSNGNDKTQYFLSGGYLDEKGVLNTAFYKRYNFRANIDSELRKWLRVNANVSYSDYVNNGVQTGLGANRGGVVLSVINTPSYAPIWDPNNEGQYYNQFYGINNITNPLENMERDKYRRNRENRLIASGSATITFMPELTFKSSFTLDRRNALSTTFLDPISTAWGRENYGTASDNRNQNTVITFDNVLNFNKNFNKHGLDVMLGTSWTDSDYRNSWINGSHFRDSIIQTLNAANKISWDGTGTSISQWGINSYMGRVSYNFASKYLVTANMRMDGSSKLHPDHRWGTFPSFSAAWRMSSEAFMSNLEWLDDLKIRGGWGQTGNQSGIGDYSYLLLYNISRQEWWKEGQQNALPNISQANLRTKDLTWETTTQTNFGIDFTAFNNRLTITADYYYKKTTDMLMYVSLPAGQGASSITRNEGEMVNKGFEFAVNSKNIQGVFNWSTDFNISFNRNKLTKLELQKIYTAAKTSDFTNENVVRNEPGRPLGGFYGYISDGVNPETGELIYRDINKDGKISASDRTYIGDPNPDFIYGLTNTFSWKNLNLTVFIQGSYGNDIFNASRIETEGMYDGKNQSTRVLNRWKIPGQITNVPKAGFDLKNSTYFIEDGSYLRVKDISLSYNLQLPFLKKAGISRLQPYFTATNLLTWTKYKGMDPEVNQWGNSGAVQGIDWGTYPHSKSFVFGVNVEF